MMLTKSKDTTIAINKLVNQIMTQKVNVEAVYTVFIL